MEETVVEGAEVGGMTKLCPVDLLAGRTLFGGMEWDKKGGAGGGGEWVIRTVGSDGSSIDDLAAMGVGAGVGVDPMSYGYPGGGGGGGGEYYNPMREVYMSHHQRVRPPPAVPAPGHPHPHPSAVPTMSVPMQMAGMYNSMRPALVARYV